MRRSYPTLLRLIALAILDDASSFFFPGNPLAVAHWPSGWRNNHRQQERGAQDRRPAASMALAVFGDLQVAGRLTTGLFFNNMPDDEPSETYNDGTSSGGSSTTSTAKAEDVDETSTAMMMDESARSLVDESPQDKILRIRSGKLTSYEKKAFLESTLQGSRSIRTRTPVVTRIFPRDSTTTSSSDRSGTCRAEMLPRKIFSY
jgi:hypothetical protein